MKARKPQRKLKPPLVSKERAANLQAFAKSLVALCAKHRVELYAADWAAGIVIEETDFVYPEGYRYSALEGGVSPDGWGYSGDDLRMEFDIAKWIPEDEGEEAKGARG
jgi:hypothetical protein